MTAYVQVCDSSDIDANGACTVTPTWQPQPSFFPSLDAASGVTIAVAILACWATAFGYRVMRRAGD